MDSIEFCAGAGGQALGLEQAGFQHRALVEIEPDFARTLRLNRSTWDVRNCDMNGFDGRPFNGMALFAAGLPCPPFSTAGKQLGERDERNLFPAAFRLIDEIRPQAIMIENVRGFLAPNFDAYRAVLRSQFAQLGYQVEWTLLNACDFGVPQLRPRVVIVAMHPAMWDHFAWPAPARERAPTVGAALLDLMAARGWHGAEPWAARACDIAPTIVGGSKKHGGPDLGPTRARRAWAALGVEGRTIAEHAPDPDFVGLPRLTIPMVAKLQGFPADWQFFGRKTTAYRQVGNAFPPPVARAVAEKIRTAITSHRRVFATRAA